MKEKPRFALYTIILWLIVGFGIGWVSNNTFAEPKLGDAEKLGETQLTEADMSLFWDVWEKVQDQYIDASLVDEQDEIYGAISGMVDALEDPYSDFMTPEETSEFEVALNGELEGIGAELTVRDEKLVIVSPLKDSPAEKAGLLPGDQVYLVDGDPASDMTVWDAIMRIRGEKGTNVTLTIVRDGIEDPFEITVTRDSITVPSVEVSYEEVEDENIAVLSIYQFENDTYSEFLNAMRGMTLNNVDGMVLDLRGNGGGYLDVAIQVLGQFFDDKVKGVIVKKRDSENEIMYTQGGGDLANMPLAVLIDEGSASASEILSGALQDYDRAELFGEQSFGKGCVQEFATLSGGSSLRLTIARWFTPNDRTIDKVGIEPDVVIEMESSVRGTDSDVQLQAALDYLAQQ